MVHRLGASDAHQQHLLCSCLHSEHIFMLPVDSPVCVCVCVFSTTVSDVNEN